MYFQNHVLISDDKRGAECSSGIECSISPANHLPSIIDFSSDNDEESCDNDDQNQFSCRSSDSSECKLDIQDANSSMNIGIDNCQITEDEYKQQIQKMREKHRLQQQKRRLNETPEQRAARLERGAERQRLKRQNLTDEEKIRQKEAARKQQKERRSRESEEQREIRKIKDRMRMREKRALIKQVSNLGPDAVAQSCVQLLSTPQNSLVHVPGEVTPAYNPHSNNISLNLSSLFLDPAFAGLRSPPSSQSETPVKTDSNASSPNMLKLNLNDLKNGNILISLAQSQSSNESLNNSHFSTSTTDPAINQSPSFFCDASVNVPQSSMNNFTKDSTEMNNTTPLPVLSHKTHVVDKEFNNSFITDTGLDSAFPKVQNTTPYTLSDTNFTVNNSLPSGTASEEPNGTSVPLVSLSNISSQSIATPNNPADSGSTGLLPISSDTHFSSLKDSKQTSVTATSIALPSNTLYTVAKDYLATEHEKYLIQKEKSKLRCRNRRANESSEQRAERLKKSAERQRRKRSHLTEEEKEEVNKKNRERAKRRRSMESIDEKEKRRSTERVRRQQQRTHFKQSTANMCNVTYSTAPGHHDSQVMFQHDLLQSEPGLNPFNRTIPPLNAGSSFSGMQNPNSIHYSVENHPTCSNWMPDVVDGNPDPSNLCIPSSVDISSVLLGFNSL